MKRPVPVILSASLLGLLAILELLGSVSMAAAAIFFRKGSSHAATAAPMPLPPGYMTLLMLVFSLFFAALAVWSIVTLIGLVRMQSWARYSILVIAGCMAGFGAVATLTSLAMPFLMPAASTQAAADPHLMRSIFFFTAAVYAIFTATGVVLLVYFNLAKTRALFLQNAPSNLDPPNTSTGRPRPTAVTVISWIFLVSALFCLPYALLPFPAFLFGFVFYGFAAHFVYATIAILTFAIGYGLLRLHNQARLAVYALYALCPLQLFVLLTPWGARQVRLYMDAFTSHMYAGQTPPPNFASSTGAILLFSFLGMAGCGVILWLLQRHRAAFTPAPPPPPLMPIHPKPIAG